MSNRTLHSVIDALEKGDPGPAIVHFTRQDIETVDTHRLANRAKQFAHRLTGRGLETGDRVVLLADSGPNWIGGCLGVLRARGVVVPLDVHLESHILDNILRDSDPRFILAGERHLEHIEGLDIAARHQVLNIDELPEEEESPDPGARDDESRPEADPQDAAVLFYTSGTTGPPKGVPLTHANLVFQLETVRDTGLVGDGDRVLLPLPLHHVYPFVIGMLVPLATGLPIIVPHALTGPEVLRAIREARVTAVIGVPRLYSALAAAISGKGGTAGRLASAYLRPATWLTTAMRKHMGLRAGSVVLYPLHRRIGPELRLLACGGAPLAPELAIRLEGIGWDTAVGYGLTETSPLLTLRMPDDGRPRSVGKPIPGVEIRIERAWRRPVAEEDEADSTEDESDGEVVARGPGVFSGYRNLPGKTAEVFTDDGWFRTGDLGFFDEDGFLYLTGRASTLIVTESGKNIQPQEIEEEYEKEPAIGEVGVLERNGRLAAVIIPPAETVGGKDLQEIEESVRHAIRTRSANLPSYKQITDYVISRESLARTRLGKIQRHRLEDHFDRAKEGTTAEELGPVPIADLSDRDQSLLDDPRAKQVWDLLAGKFPRRRITPDTSLQADLGIDSMEWLGLSTEIQRKTQHTLTEDAIGEMSTVRDLLEEVSRSGTADLTEEELEPLHHPDRALTDRQKRWLRPLNVPQRLLSYCMLSFNRILMRILFRLDVSGLENLPKDEPHVIAPNHESYLDAFVIAAALGNRRLRNVYWAGWTGAAFANPVNRSVSRLAQVVPVDPRKGAVSSLAFAAAVLGRKYNLVWFPEGGRSRTGELQPFRPGIGLLLDHFEPLVVPTRIDGTYEAMPVGAAVPRPVRVTVEFGKPVPAEELRNEGTGDTPPEKIVNALYARMASWEDSG